MASEYTLVHLYLERALGLLNKSGTTRDELSEIVERAIEMTEEEIHRCPESGSNVVDFRRYKAMQAVRL